MREISPQEFKRRRDAGEDLVLLDVREPDEIATARVEGATTIPMGEVAERLAEIRRDTPVVVMCHHGGRSARVVQFLEGQGYTNAVNLDGGIDAWSLNVDPAVPRY